MENNTEPAAPVELQIRAFKELAMKSVAVSHYYDSIHDYGYSNWYGKNIPDDPEARGDNFIKCTDCNICTSSIHMKWRGGKPYCMYCLRD